MPLCGTWRLSWGRLPWHWKREETGGGADYPRSEDSSNPKPQDLAVVLRALSSVHGENLLECPYFNDLVERYGRRLEEQIVSCFLFYLSIRRYRGDYPSVTLFGKRNFSPCFATYL
jgi:hypothetical protein